MTNELQKLTKLAQAIKPQVLKLLGDTTLRFIDDNFARQGFQGASFTRWPARSKNTRGGTRKILSGKTGALRRSPKKILHSNSVTIVIDVPYAKIHNDGGPLRRGHGKTSGHNKSSTGGGRMPQRKFAGSSPVLNKMCEKAVTTFLNQTLKQNRL